MDTLITFVKTFLGSTTAKFEEQYLADSVDLADLEHRMRWLEQRRRAALAY